MKLPYIFIFDWDGTIAGKVDFQSYAYNLTNHLKRHGFRPNDKKVNIQKAFSPSSKLIRPGFVAFMKAMHEWFDGNVYFFVYTASEKQWAHQEIQWFEKAHNIRFQRPLFTRDDCVLDANGSYKKSITKIYPRICRALGKNHMPTKRDKEQILQYQTVIVDNNPVYIDTQQKLLICPHYNYMVFENLLELIPDEARTNPYIQQYVLSLINDGVMCPLPSHDDEMIALSSAYSWIATNCKQIVERNREYMNDDFWKRLRRLITKNDIRTFSPSIINKLQRAIWKRNEL